jgi:hypothetical protein
LVSVDEANTSCIGVALITDSNQFVIYNGNYVHNYYWARHFKYIDVPNIPNIDNTEELKKDFNGKANTEAL